MKQLLIFVLLLSFSKTIFSQEIKTDSLHVVDLYAHTLLLYMKTKRVQSANTIDSSVIVSTRPKFTKR